MSKEVFGFSTEIFGIEDVCCISVTREKGYTIERSGRKNSAFLFTEKGSMIYGFNDGKSLGISAGRMVFIPEGTSYFSAYKEDNTTVKIVQFDLAFGVLPDKLKKPCEVKISGIKEWILGFFEFNTNKLYHVYKTYEMIIKITEDEKNAEPEFQRLKPALEHIRKNYEQNLKVEDYALLCSVSQSHFRRLFSGLTGFSPIEYRNRIRLSEAKKLIESGEYNVEEAAHAVGFFNTSFFCRSYKRMYGKTPLGK